MRKTRRYALLLVAWLLLGLAPGLSTALAQESTIASGLLDLLQYLETQQKGGLKLSDIPLPPTVRIDAEGRVQVILSLSAVTSENLDHLSGHGVVIEAEQVAEKLVQARIPLNRVQEVSELPFIRQIRLPSYGIPNVQGAVGTEGDAVVKADLTRERLGLDGSGIRVGVISNGIGALSLVVANGDLPPTELIRGESGFGFATESRGGVTGRSFRADGSIEGALGQSAMEGTAILEIVHDVAPGAQLFFAAISTEIDFVNAVKWLRDEAGGPNSRRGTPGGVDIMVNNFAFFDNGPFDGSSAASRAATEAVGKGVAFFTSAGNAALRHYQGRFSDPDGNTFHNFSGTDEALRITVGGGQTVTVTLSWSDPREGSGNDYNLRAFDAQGNPLTVGVFGGRDPQTGTQPPAEVLTIMNTSFITAKTVDVMIDNVGNRASPRELSLFVFGAPVPIDHNVPSGSVLSPGDAPEVIAVGAVNQATPDTIEPFSSQGPTADGRLTPRLVAPDGVSTTISGPHNFFGTSAAAPHAAAVAALLLNHNPRLSPDQLVRVLEVTAADLGAPGPDTIFGFGLVDALASATLPMLDLTLNASAYRTDERMVLDVFLRAGATLNRGDAYIVGILPTEAFVSLVLQPDSSLLLVDGLVPLQRGFSAFDHDGPVFERPFTPTDPRGPYLVVGAIVLEGQDPTDQHNWIIFDIEEFTLAP